MHPSFVSTVALLAALCSLPAEANPQADSFANIYATTCLKYLSNLDALREKLRAAPPLPPEKAASFLRNEPGTAWAVPDKNGLFVLALPTGKRTCTVYARRVGAPEAESLFAGLVATAPSPLQSRLASDERAQSSKNGATHTIAYEWSVPNASRKMLFMLTTATGEAAELQGLATASYVQ